MAFGSPRDGRSLEQQLAEDEVVEIMANAGNDTGGGVEKFLDTDEMNSTDPGFSLSRAPGSKALGKLARELPNTNGKQLTEHELADIPTSPRTSDYEHPTPKDEPRLNRQLQS